MELPGTVIGMFKEIGAGQLPSFFLKNISPGTGNEVNHRTASLPSPKTIMKAEKINMTLFGAYENIGLAKKLISTFLLPPLDKHE